MDSQEMREFYDICQAYRTAPVSDLPYVAGCYENLLKWAKGHAALAADRERERCIEVFLDHDYDEALAILKGRRGLP